MVIRIAAMQGAQEFHALLALRGVGRHFRGGVLSRRRVVAVHGVDLQMRGDAPSILAIIGESGSGKTTLARMLLRLLTPSEGTIRLDGRPLAELAPEAFRRVVQPVFQNPFEAFSLYLPVSFYLLRSARNLAGAASDAAARELAGEALQSVGLSWERVAGKYVQQFSGGELQRIAIARALIARPRLIVADEPVSMVDASLRTNIVNLFLELTRTQGVSFVYITHDISTAYYIADDIVIMQSGRVVEHGRPQEVLRAPRHDYTKALLSAVPRMGVRWAETD
jgi:peptide/nickel transport system ATP-binding protein